MRNILLLVLALLLSPALESWGDEKQEQVQRERHEKFTQTKAKAEQGDAASQHDLEVMCDSGFGVEKSPVEAAKWYRQAAEQGLAPAQNNLGAMYVHGQGVERNFVEGYAWYNLAAPGSATTARNRDSLATQMTPQQIAAAHERTKELRALIAAKTGGPAPEQKK